MPNEGDAGGNPLPLYVIDSSALIDLRLIYPLKTFGRLWQRFADLAGEGRLFAPDEVRQEISRKDDELKEWAADVDSLFRNPDDDFMACWARVVRECDYLVPLNRRYSADSWVVALALQVKEAERAKLFGAECHVISHEERPNKPGAPGKIPNACDFYGLSHIRLVKIFELEEWEGH